MKYIFIAGASDIGKALINSLNKNYNKIIYTYRKSKLKNNNLISYKLDITNKREINNFIKNKSLKNWDNLTILPATQKPIGSFTENDPEEWMSSVDLNFTYQMYLLRKLLPLRNKKKTKSIILWAGGGTNNSVKNYSAYTVSKIAQTKMAELLNHEIKDIKISIIGPGFVKTKIHNETLESINNDHYAETKRRLKEDFNPISKVVKCFNKVIASNKKIYGGRNISAEFDKWNTHSLDEILKYDQDIFKLRRDFNDFQVADIDINVNNVIDFFEKNKNFQNNKSQIYKVFKRLLSIKFAKQFYDNKEIKEILGIKIKFPLISFGNTSSAKLFDLDELLIFNFYKKKKFFYKKVCDIGGNIGLHSLLMSKLGFKVDYFEPDNKHFLIAKKIFKKNKSIINLNKLAISDYTGYANFSRIEGNSTGSYINDKKNGYGKILKYKVKTLDSKKLRNKYDLIKIDAEGSEVEILNGFTKKDFKSTDFLIEISSEKNKEAIWNLKKKYNLKVYSQKNFWQKVNKIENLPDSYKEGTVFISEKNKF